MLSWGMFVVVLDNIPTFGDSFGCIAKVKYDKIFGKSCASHVGDIFLILNLSLMGSYVKNIK